MTDAEKIEWLSATNKALMESQERLAGEVKELREIVQWIRDEWCESHNDNHPEWIKQNCLHCRIFNILGEYK